MLVSARTYIFLLAASLLLLAAAPARAQLCTASSTPVAFGAYDYSSNTPLDSAGTVSWVCLSSLTVTVTLSKGGGASFAGRTLSGPSSASYNLYVDAARTKIWGDGTSGTYTSAAVLGLVGALPVYGRVPINQPLKVGNYTDTVVVTLNF